MLVLFELMRKIKAILTQLCSLCAAKNRLHSIGYWYAHDQKKLFLIILNNIVYYTFFLWVLWSSTKRNYQLSYNACTFWINEENKSYSYTVVFSYVQQKIDFGLIDHKRLVKMSGWFEPLMTTIT